MKLHHVPALLGMLFTAAVVAQQPGEQWQYQGNMEMMGMKMPVPMSTVCQPPDQKDITPPVEKDSNCKVDDVSTQGNTTTFKMSCGEPTPMEGSGTATRTNDTLEINYAMKSDQGEMKFMMTGKKLGDCTM